jgi:hypothetical protein
MYCVTTLTRGAAASPGGRRRCCLASPTPADVHIGGQGRHVEYGREAVQELTMLGRQERRGLLGVRRTRGIPASANRSLV